MYVCMITLCGKQILFMIVHDVTLCMCALSPGTWYICAYKCVCVCVCV